MSAPRGSHRSVQGSSRGKHRSEAGSYLTASPPSIEQLESFARLVRMVAAGLPEDDPRLGMLGSALAERLAGVASALSGHWRPEHVQAFTRLRRIAQDVLAVGGSVDPGLIALATLTAANGRAVECLSRAESTRPAEWPALAELDELATGLESAVESLPDAGLPLDSLRLGAHLNAGCLLLAWVQRDFDTGPSSRDRIWLTETVQRLRRARDHLVVALTELTDRETVLAEIAPTISALTEILSRAGDATAEGADEPLVCVWLDGQRQSHPLPAALDILQAAQHPAEPRRLRPGIRVLHGLRRWHACGWRRRSSNRSMISRFLARPVARVDPLAVSTEMADLMTALNTGRWTPKEDDALTKLQAIADGLGVHRVEPDSSDLGIRATVAFARLARYSAKVDRSLQDRWPDRAELVELGTEFESIIAELDDSDPSQQPFAASLHGALGMVQTIRLAELRRDAEDGDLPDPNDEERLMSLLSSARDHLGRMAPLLPDRVRAELEQVSDVMGRLVRPGLGTVGGQDMAAATGIHALNVLRPAAMALQASQTREPAQLAATVEGLRAARRGLPAGHPAHVWTLGLLAHLLARSDHGEAVADFAEAVDMAIESVRVAPPNNLWAAAGVLVRVLGMVRLKDERVGPFEQAELALTAALGRCRADDPLAPVIIWVGIGAARSLRSRTSQDENLVELAGQALVGAYRMLPEPEPTDGWFYTAWMLFMSTHGHAVHNADTAAAEVATRIAERLEYLLNGHANFAGRMSERFYGARPPKLANGGAGLLQMLQIMIAGLPVTGDGGPPNNAPQNSPEAFRIARSSQSDVDAPPPPSAAAEETRRLANQGLDRAADGLGGDKPTATSRRPLDYADAPDPAILRAAVADLRAALAGGLDDDDLRHRVDASLGVCLAEMYWQGAASASSSPAGERAQASTPGRGHPAGPLASTLAAAIRHLDRSLVGSRHIVPTTQRADLLDVLARCYRESAQRRSPDGAEHMAERDADATARAALHELGLCVLAATDTEDALEIAARANEVVARAVGWCLADGRAQEAVDIAEAGRSLVLASVVLTGQVEEVLRRAGHNGATDGWRHGAGTTRAAWLPALWTTAHGHSLLTPPSAEHVSALLGVATGLDAVVYIVPPALADGPAGISTAAVSGYALVLRPRREPELIELPGAVTGPGTPLDSYLATFDAALDADDPSRRHLDDFRGSPAGQAWAEALDRLGTWTYAHVIGPLVEHTRRWSLAHEPHLALVPLGAFAAIPYAAAWTRDDSIPGGRRYAIHDLVLTHTVSARLLAEVVRRPRPPLSERVVLVTDPTGDFPYARATAKTLATRLYPGAEVYGRRSAAHGPATTAALLGALPGKDRRGASLLHLSTHGATAPEARLQTADGWLPLSRILAQARDRPTDTPGGLVITNACLTDSTRTHYDESLTLATALLAAGATAVIGTRWPIQDGTAATLAYRLHHHLNLGFAPARALRLAQLDLLDPTPAVRRGLHPHLAALPHPELAHPASWAGHVHHGS